MKKIILTTLAIILMANINKAQENKDVRDKLMFGLKAGANYSNVYDTKGEEFHADAKFGFAGGAFISIPIGKFMGIQPEILFSQKGFQATGSILGYTYKFTRTTNYIDIPLFFALKPSSFLTLLAGPQFSYMTKQSDVFSSSTINSEQEQEFKNSNVRKNILCFTGGVDINLTHIVLGARVGWDVQNNNGDGTSTNPRYKNVWYQATIGYRFYN
ncbi:MAG: porin family protein [Bacteroidales bacterium]|jgi:hypothetical protein